VTAAHATTPAASIDITGESCPMTYVRTKLRLETLSPGDVLEVLLRGDEPRRNVPRSAREDGHVVLALEPAGGDAWRLLIRKGQER
jgi:TusA-related sulfurtransferase